MSLDFLGRGPAFPFRLTLGPDDMAGGEALVEMSIDQILGTAEGERLMRPDFGSKLPYLLFENTTEVIEAMAATYVEDALERWEPRITVLGVDAQADSNKLEIHLHYMINATNNVRNRVYVYDLKGVS
ncbi:MAG TPA: GPW/gp25 family protein [Firmicutes bacterium]|nr:GPW/gp25 family protein [Bacillota bacterium]